WWPRRRDHVHPAGASARVSPMTSFLELNADFLHFLVREQPNQRLVGQVTDLNAVTPRIAKVAAEAGVEFQLVLLHEFIPDFLNLLRIPDHQPEMLDSIGL